MNVSLMSFSKKKNSTATPSSGGSPMNGTLREGCSVIRPIIGFEMSRLVFANWNYAYISDFYRYYYIQDWVWDDGLWWAYMEVDPMASFKAEIGASSCYVLRSASEYDNSLNDGLYPTEAFSYGYSPAEYEDYLNVHTLEQGTYIVGVIGQGGSGTVGAVNYYALTATAMATFRTQLLTDTDFIGITEITTELLKALLNPFQYVVSCVWFPIPYASISGSAVASIKLGWWTINASAKAVSSFTYSINNEYLTAYAVPEATSDGGGFRYSSPYSQYTLVMPPFGEINLDSQIIGEGLNYTLSGQVRLEFTIKIDLVSGNGYMELWCREYTLGFFEGKFGVPVQLGQITQNVGGALTTGVGAVTGVSDGNVGSVIGNIVSGVQNIMPRVTTKGLNAGITLFDYGAYVTSKYNKIVEDSITENGRPLCKTKTISSLSGYIQTMNADVTLSGATDAEQEQVRAMMNGGFFYE